MAEVNPNPLVFKGPTASQQRKAAEPIKPRLEPLVWPMLKQISDKLTFFWELRRIHETAHFQPGLAKAQERNKPEYIQKLEKERLIQEGILKPDSQGLFTWWRLNRYWLMHSASRTTFPILSKIHLYINSTVSWKL